MCSIRRLHNDAYSIPRGPMLAYSHPSDAISTILAAGEQMSINGKELITNIVLAYELSGRFTEAVLNKPMEERGWNSDSRGIFITPLIAGRIFGLTSEQMINAYGISGSRGLILGILDSEEEVYTMAKNMRFAYTGHNGILAAYLAEEGFTGPPRALEGDKGFIKTVVNNEFDIDLLLNNNEPYRILKNDYKPFPANRSSHGHISATLKLVREHDIEPKQIKKVNVYSSTRVAKHTGNLSKKYPTNKESADHSAFYLTAVAIAEREVGIKQFTPERYSDPVINQLIDKVTIEANPELDSLGSAGISEIYTVDGKKYQARVDYPKGSPKNPMSDNDLVDKFRSLANDHYASATIEKVIKLVWELESLNQINSLMELLKKT